VAERAAGLRTGQERDARTHADQARPGREHVGALASIVRASGSDGSGLGRVLAATNQSVRAEALASLQRERGNVAVQRLLAVQREWPEDLEAETGLDTGELGSGAVRLLAGGLGPVPAVGSALYDLAEAGTGAARGIGRSLSLAGGLASDVWDRTTGPVGEFVGRTLAPAGDFAAHAWERTSSLVGRSVTDTARGARRRVSGLLEDLAE
jgi:hypothetical protein